VESSLCSRSAPYSGLFIQVWHFAVCRTFSMVSFSHKFVFALPEHRLGNYARFAGDGEDYILTSISVKILLKKQPWDLPSSFWARTCVPNSFLCFQLRYHWNHLDAFGRFLMHLDVFGCILTHLEGIWTHFECIWMHWEHRFEKIQVFLDV